MEQLSFEEALARLEEIVGRMEAGEVSLDASLALFEEGVALSRLCATRLDEAEKRIVVLLEAKDGSIQGTDLDASGDPDPGAGD